ncbi:MAG TPA: RNB domain-containing ribonuclease, partial [Methylophilaceae bacterium]|nr:RNB domain-containing ribonuclease [Methylophilaceae bacterium]
ETQNHEAIFRVHEGPSEEKLELLRTFMAEFGFSVSGGDKPHAKDYAKLMQQIKGRHDEQLLQTVLLRSMQQAVYQPENLGHFGLAYEAYTHFTSPIRRYPDLLVHRAIKAAINKQTYKIKDWAAIGEHCSMTERRADDASRDVTNWLKCYYMQDKVGDIFEGTISGVTSFGVFVALDDAYVEGLLHVTELGNDYFHYDKAHHEMVGERTHVKYRLGDRVKIKVARVDLETTKIDFTLINKLTSAKDPLIKEIVDHNLLQRQPKPKTPAKKGAKPTTSINKKTKKSNSSRKSSVRKKR